MSILQKIISLTWQQTGNDITKLARWIRCLFNLTLSNDDETSLRCAEQAAHISSEKRGVRCSVEPLEDVDLDSANCETQKPDRYPPTELEWLATSTFNRAVDYYLQENPAKCKKWAEQSFVLAQQLEDDGLVREFLLEKYSGMQFDR